MKKGSGDRPFIMLSGVEDVDANTRKLIRSHVMLGKNQKKKKLHTKRGDALTCYDNSSDLSRALSNASSFSIPNKVGSDLSFAKFADSIELSTIQDIIKFWSTAKRSLFPLEACIVFNKTHHSWFAPMTFDAAYLHAMAFGTQAFFSWALGRNNFPAGDGASVHLVKTLRLLRERLLLNDERQMLTNQTISVILTLAVYARFTGDNTSGKNHLLGLRKIVNLRGGIFTFRDNPSLLTEIFRCDLAMALHNGDQPVLFDDPSLEPYIQYPIIPGFQDDVPDCLASIDDELIRAWKAMKRFCSLVNLVSQAKGGITPETFLETMASVMYRLYNMSFEAGSVNETIRLGLLAFSSNVFLQWKDVRQSYHSFYTTYKGHVLEIVSSDSLSPRLMLWLYTIYCISIFTESDGAWIRSSLRAKLVLNNVTSWSDMQEIMNALLWIGMIHDQPGKDLFEAISFPHRALECGI